LRLSHHARPEKFSNQRRAILFFSRCSLKSVKLKQKYAQLTDDDLAFAQGKEDELLGRLEHKLGKTKEDLRREMESL
jgi:uncharacterized protein YjbJ (UPF0337 family)